MARGREREALGRGRAAPALNAALWRLTAVFTGLPGRDLPDNPLVARTVAGHFPDNRPVARTARGDRPRNRPVVRPVARDLASNRMVAPRTSGDRGEAARFARRAAAGVRHPRRRWLPAGDGVCYRRAMSNPKNKSKPKAPPAVP